MTDANIVLVIMQSSNRSNFLLIRSASYYYAYLNILIYLVATLNNCVVLKIVFFPAFLMI